MSKLTKALTAAAGNAGESLYVEDVFSTYLYEGNGTARTITNGIDIAGEGGLVWTKARTSSIGAGHILGTPDAAYVLKTESTGYNWSSLASMYTAFNSDGYAITNNNHVNENTKDFASWTFRKAEKFFDIQTWTGDGTGARTISHSLNGTVGALFMKATNADMQWFSYHNGLTNAQFLELNATTSAVSSANAWNNTTPTSSEFTVGSYGNISGRTYVAYLFASDAGGFGDDGSENIIKCGSYTGNGGTQEINLGFEPQWLLIKSSTQTDSWFLTDTMRGMPNNSPTPYLLPNLSNAEAEASAGYFPQATATGFKIGASGSVNGSGQTFIYIAIRRPMKTPESGTEVFAASTRTGTTAPSFPASFDVVDAAFRIYRPGGGDYARKFGSRLTGTRTLYTSSAAAEAPDSEMNWDYMDGWNSDTGVNTDVFSWMFKRATGFMDVVCYNGTGVANTSISHNLGVVPEFIILKDREDSQSWVVYHKDIGNSNVCLLNNTSAAFDSNNFNDQTPTDSVFYLGGPNTFGNYANNNIAYLFATLAGVSKVGSYTGTGADLNVDCGFSAGARFILIKRTDSTGDWYVYDSVRGIVAGNDPYLLLNSTAAEVTNTDYIDPLSSGFTVTSSAPAALNASGGTYIFLAIA